MGIILQAFWSRVRFPIHWCVSVTHLNPLAKRIEIWLRALKRHVTYSTVVMKKESDMVLIPRMQPKYYVCKTWPHALLTCPFGHILPYLICLLLVILFYDLLHLQVPKLLIHIGYDTLCELLIHTHANISSMERWSNLLGAPGAAALCLVCSLLQHVN